MKKIITQRPKQTKNPANKNHNRNWTPKQIHWLLLELWIIIWSSFLGTISHPTGVAWVLWIRFEIWFGKVFYSQPTVWHNAPFFGIETSHVEGWHGGGKTPKWDNYMGNKRCDTIKKKKKRCDIGVSTMLIAVFALS